MVEAEKSLLNVNVVPTTDTLVAFAQLEPGAAINIVSSNRPTLELLVLMVRTYAEATPDCATLIYAPEAPAAVASVAEVIPSIVDHSLPRYSSSVTCSSQSTALPSRVSAMAMWLIATSGDAPCQCFSPGANHTISAGRTSSTGPPSR